MKFRFTIQDYQTEATDAVVKVFAGQPFSEGIDYILDKGSQVLRGGQFLLDSNNPDDEIGLKNNEIILDDDKILQNINEIQSSRNIKESEGLVKTCGRCSLDVEMETGTGKTYVYIKTIYELNKKYGWSKFIIVVPSIAIREGVRKSFDTMKEHFGLLYDNKQTELFIYDSSNLQKLDDFASNDGIMIMIINMQAFNTSFKEGGKNEAARKIFDERDEFGSRKPIDVIAATNPIIILDEPQKMLGKKTQEGLAKFNPLFMLNYSATHREQHNLVYVLDAVDAFNEKLVKRIEVKGFEIRKLTGTSGYLHLEQIVLSKNDPVVSLDFEKKSNTTISRIRRTMKKGDDLFFYSGKLPIYQGYVISEIDGEKGYIEFSNGIQLKVGEVQGDDSKDTIRRLQIRETIKSHFDKEQMLFDKGIKVLSLFFIDEVSKYRQYDEDGNPQLGIYGKVFEEEYKDVLDEILNELTFSPAYKNYLISKCSEPHKAHQGYFSIDPKTHHSIDSETKRGEDYSDDTSAYDLILKDKERLLSFDEPTRFIFSHSALREGWDNPNIFQICTLKNANSNIAKRQEVGRGLRLCVNQDGCRMDLPACGKQVQVINTLTVVASESYSSFVSDLQNQIKENLIPRERLANQDYFIGKTIYWNDTPHKITQDDANVIYRYLIKNDYIDDSDKLTQSCRNAIASNELAPLPEKIAILSEGLPGLLNGVYDDSVFAQMITDGNKLKIRQNPLNEKFYSKEFQQMWNLINHKYSYTVNFDSNELIEEAIALLNKELNVSIMTYSYASGMQDETINRNQLEKGLFHQINESGGKVKLSSSSLKYDLIGRIASETLLTRKTIAAILKGIESERFKQFSLNPEDFIRKAIQSINDAKGTTFVSYIDYNQTDQVYEDTIFTSKVDVENDKVYKADKCIQDYVLPDGFAIDSTERKFARALDLSEEVVVYSKLPTTFKIPTPFGNYSPDWAVVFQYQGEKHIFFIVETKGNMRTVELGETQKSKIDYARALYEKLASGTVHYEKADTFINLYNDFLKLKEQGNGTRS